MVKPIDERVLDAWLAFHKKGENPALVTLVNVDGSSPRPLGSQIAISKTGKTVGYITGGCAEAALAAEAVDAITTGKNRLRRYGDGSPYMDVRLPCGAGIDVHFAVGVDDNVIGEIVDRLATRKSCGLAFDLKTGAVKVVDAATTTYDAAAGVFQRRYEPTTRLEIIGKGPVVPALASLGVASGFSVSVYSPEEGTLAQSSKAADRVGQLSTPESYSANNVDCWTAAAILFHEHDWEPAIVQSLLARDCFYVGALGSRKTHQARVETLRALGVSESAIQSIKGPIGLDIHATSPEEIAISILAEIIETRRAQMPERRW